MAKTLSFLIELDFPTERAYAKNVVSTLDVLARKGRRIKIYAGGSKTSLKEIRDQYGIEQDLSFNFTPTINIPGKLIFLGLWQFFKVLFRKNTIISGRFIVPLYFLSFFREVNFEYHSPIWKQGSMYHFMFNRLMRSDRCKSMVVPNKNLYLDFFEAYPKYQAYKEKVFLVSNGASKKNSDIRKDKDAGILNIGYIGSFYSGKGLEIIEELVDDVENCKFHLAGGPAELLEKNHPQLVRAPSVEYHGYLTAEEIDKLALEMDVFLLPNAKVIKTGAKSDIGRYTNPLKLFEYMSYYRPVICSDLDYLRNVLGDLGFYCTSTDDWIRTIDFLKENQVRVDYGQKIREEFLTNYTITRRAERLESILLP